MTLMGNVVWFEMYLDEQTVQAMDTGKVPWYKGQDAQDYRCEGLDPAIFADTGVPMKFWSEDHKIALHWYFRALNREMVSFPPKKIYVASMPAVRFLEHCLKGDIVIYFERRTCAFKKPVIPVNYPELKFELFDIADDVGKAMVDPGK